MAFLVAMPALIVPGTSAEASQATVLIAILAAMFTFVEYSASSPGIVEFRDAAPFNRLRFMALLMTVFVLSMICKGEVDPTPMTETLTSVGTLVGSSIDMPYSPVRLVVLILPADVDQTVVQSVRNAAGIAYVISFTAMAAFFVLVRVLGWPSRSGSFNVWVNLPLFDPTAGGDVLRRLYRDARINVVLGFLLPFVIPAVIKLAADVINPISLENPHILIWTMSAWAFLSASMIMRGIALYRVAAMIRDQRMRAYASADGGLQAV